VRRIGDIDWKGAPAVADAVCGARQVEPWLTAILQAEHLSLLLGNVLSTATVSLGGGSPVPMSGGSGLSARCSTSNNTAVLNRRCRPSAGLELHGAGARSHAVR
jgi:hypothetical protein